MHESKANKGHYVVVLFAVCVWLLLSWLAWLALKAFIGWIAAHLFAPIASA